MKAKLASLGLALLAAVLPAAAQDYPVKPVKIIVPFSAGALTDTLARLYAEKLTQRLGQPFIVENKPGSGGIPAMQAMLSAPADGYTLQMVSSSHAVNPTLFSKLPYDTVKDVSGVALVASSPTVVIVRNDLNVKSLPELIALAKAKPGQLNYGSAGIGGATHLVGEYLKTEAKIDIVHVPYKGVQEAVTEVMAGRIDIAFPPIALAQQQLKAGRVGAVALTDLQRTPLLPDVKTAEEQGLKGFEYTIWYALVAPARMPRPVAERLAREVNEITAMPDVQQKMAQQGLVPKQVVLDKFDAYIASEIRKLGVLVKASGARAD